MWRTVHKTSDLAMTCLGFIELAIMTTDHLKAGVETPAGSVITNEPMLYYWDKVEREVPVAVISRLLPTTEVTENEITALHRECVIGGNLEYVTEIICAPPFRPKRFMYVTFPLLAHCSTILAQVHRDFSAHPVHESAHIFIEFACTDT